ncbi:MAG: PhzF family phenazine biosynthesis protein, partial [SAR324 cluster bacterium]|nr:PhzF family phenazine biosynthesis protein [SAR324 cluster bacterium]
RSRLFAPVDGVTEDPATGSAICALAGLLSELKEEEEVEFHWKIAQGVEMGRPSTLFARAKKVEGKTAKTWIGGNCVQIAEGILEIP